MAYAKGKLGLFNSPLQPENKGIKHPKKIILMCIFVLRQLFFGELMVLCVNCWLCCPLA